MAVGFAIIGCGMIATTHARAIGEIRGAKLVACHDRTFAKAQALGAATGARPYEHLPELLAAAAVQVVVVGTPSGAHLEPAVAAARAGKHVIVEKPLEITLKRCDAIISACCAAKVLLTTIFPSRFHAAAIELKRAIDAKRFGTLTLADAYVKWFRTQQYYDSGKWRGTWELDGGGALMNQGIHSADLLLWFMGPVSQVTAQTATLAHERIAVEDTLVATLRFANGALGVIEASTAAFPGSLKRIEISGSTGSAILEEETLKAWNFVKALKSDQDLLTRFTGNTRTGGGASDPAAIGHLAHAKQFANMVAAIKKQREPAIAGAEGRKAVELILAIYKAAESGKVIHLPLTADPTLHSRKNVVK
jgi:predicted dehydrogenase